MKANKRQPRSKRWLGMEPLESRCVPSGIDSLGVYRAGEFYLDIGAPGYQGERPYYLGSPGDQALAGDWDGDGRDQLGYFRDGKFHLHGQTPFAFGLPGDRPIVGDWDGDGKDQVGVFRTGPN
jgi:hypothetical protein